MPETPGFTRRMFAAGTLGACAMLGLGGVRYLPAQPVVRPPGGQDDDRLLGACLHCEKCREVCPKGAVSPAHLEHGILSARTPRMNFRKGWCDFCEEVGGGPRCVAVCPTGALRLPEGDGPIIIGIAELTRDWCLATRGMGCRECVDACEYEALELGDDNVPVVIEDKCNGCGACELACISLSSGSIAPGATDRAIVVVPPSTVGA